MKNRAIKQEWSPLESMTGFASVEEKQSGFFLSVTARSVNARSVDVRVRLPSSLGQLEPDIRGRARSMFGRGKIDIDVQLLPGSASPSTFAVDMERARAVRDGLTEIVETLGVDGPINLDAIVRAGGSHLFTTREDVSQKNVLGEAADTIITRALDGLRSTRLREGDALRTDLLEGLDALSLLTEKTETASTGISEEYRQKLLSKLKSFQEHLVDEGQMRRVEQEIALFAEKVDIHEELVRLKTHNQAFEETLLAEAGNRGKRLDFLLQEMGREVNTLGSKIPRAEIRGLVVDMKVLVETLRQQVSNIA
jgi:uncharacterized protein (TIGR00255 family)